MATLRKVDSARRRGLGAANGVVDSYTALKAAQRAVRPRAVTEGDELQRLGAQVRQAAVPTKQLIECYECGYRFQLHGKVPKTNCNKCRATLDLTDHTINERWSGTLKTAGTIHIAGEAVIEAGAIIGNDVVLEGTIQAALVRAMRRLELHAGARFSEANVTAPDLLIAADATIAFIEPAEYRDVEIAGSLHANLHASGIVMIHAGGAFDGELHGKHLTVEAGGGLRGALRIESPAAGSAV